MWERIREILIKELKQTLRDPRMRATLIMPPIIQMLVFGFAVNLDVEHSNLAWMDQDQSIESRELREQFTGSGRFTIKRYLQSETDTQDVLNRSEVDGIVRIMPGFGADVKRGREAAVQILVDGTNSNTASILSNQANTVIRQYSNAKLSELQRQKLVGRAVDRPLYAAIPVIEVQPRVWYNPELRSRNYFVPGILVNIIMLVTLSLTSLSIVREKEIGTMEQLMVTPIRPIELIIGKTLPFAAIGLVQLVFISLFALLIFRVPLHGSPWLLLFSSLFFIECTLGLGLFISTISNTQQQAMMTTLFLFQPMFMLSGFNFPIRNMPEVVQYVTYVNPMRYFMEVVRGIFLKGVGIEVLWPQIGMLALLGTTILGAAALRFRKRLD